MAGSILFNCWVALLAFSCYFLFSYPFVEGIVILIPSLICALLFFILAFFGRAAISYFLEDKTKKVEEEVLLSQNTTSSPIDSSKEYANIIKNMINNES